MIANTINQTPGNKKKINTLTDMPQMVDAFCGWMSTITIDIITQSVVDSLVTSSQRKVTFQGTIQPLTARELYLKPEGQRSWTWLMIHCFATNLNLAPNDRVLYNGERYKLMATKDYSLNNYIEYHLVRDYEPTT